MVNAPVVSTLPMAEPESVPIIADEITEALAGPPVRCPNSENASRRKKSPTPTSASSCPNRMNSTTYWAITAMGAPKMPPSPTTSARSRVRGLAGGP